MFEVKKRVNICTRKLIHLCMLLSLSHGEGGALAFLSLLSLHVRVYHVWIHVCMYVPTVFLCVCVWKKRLQWEKKQPAAQQKAEIHVAAHPATKYNYGIKIIFREKAQKDQKFLRKAQKDQFSFDIFFRCLLMKSSISNFQHFSSSFHNFFSLNDNIKNLQNYIYF